MKSPVELNSLLSKFFCYITWLLYQLIRRDTGRLEKLVLWVADDRPIKFKLFFLKTEC